MYKNQESSIFFVFIFILLIYFTGGAAQYKLSTGKCTVVGAQSDSVIVSFLRDVIIDTQPIYNDFFELQLSQEVTIFLPPSDAQYKKHTEKYIPDWSGAVAFIDSRNIILRPGNYFDAKEYRETLLHELTHIFLADKMGDKEIPLWLNEGLAMYLSGKSISWGESITIGNTLASDNFINLADIDSLLSYGYLQAQVAYLEAYLAVQYLIATYGVQNLKYILNNLKTGMSVDEAFRKTIGLDLNDFEFDFYHQVKKEYRWMVLLQFGNLLWISLVALLLIGFIIIKIRNRRIMKNWDIDDLN